MKFGRTLLASLTLIFIGCNSSPKKTDSNQPSTPPPKLLAPSVRKIWVPPHLKDGGLEWEEGHFSYRIERNSSWSR